MNEESRPARRLSDDHPAPEHSRVGGVNSDVAIELEPNELATRAENVAYCRGMTRRLGHLVALRKAREQS
jgi:hypothetical protein